MYRIEEISLANLERLYQYKLQGIYRANFGIKGFDYPWIISSHQWRDGERVLDVGAAYSPMPKYLHDTYGCEAWAVDDFGINSNEPFWGRDGSPHDFVKQHPELHYVMERLGDPEISSLPMDYFDVIYSISALEHIPGHLQAAVWMHMDSLLKTGGEILHAVDVDFPSNFGLPGMLKAAVLNTLYWILPVSIRQKYCLVTPIAYLRLCLAPLGIRLRGTKSLSILNMALNPDILAQSYEHGLNRIQKDGNKNYRYHRTGSLLIHLRKIQ